ncbi:DUF1631 family protein [Lacisediminimonas profundi]|uniref:DUF1631 family protein n=1 Tax=Lacisediminimonas profundi TaxID=2603856 RepID=UPI00124B43AF|nr:DUF1631 family protein [Lacisediminimonas profundi]
MSRPITQAAVTTAAPARQAALLHKLVHVAVALTGAKLDVFRYQLGDALLKLSETSKRPAEEQASFHAYNHLRNHGEAFCEALSVAIESLTTAALRELEKGRPVVPGLPAADKGMADSFEAMEDRVLLDELALSIEQQLAQPLEALNLRIAEVLNRDRVDTEFNPWRPQLFVLALCQAWRSIDSERASLRVVLSRLGPQLFLNLNAVYGALNVALAEHGILPDVKAIVRARRVGKGAMPFAATTSPILQARGRRYNRVRDWLLSAGKPKSADPAADQSDDLNLPDLFGTQDAGGNWQANTISVAVGPRLFGHLTRLQTELERSGGERAVPASASVLRHIGSGMPEGLLTTVDENTIELLARIFDHLLASDEIAAAVKALLARLQIPMLKAALMDRKFFINAAHPGRRLIDQLLACSVGWDQARGEDDPLFRMMSQIVDRVTAEFDQKTALFVELGAQIDAFLAEEERVAEAGLADAMAGALRAERRHQAHVAAQADLNERLDTGAVPQFMEAFLETQWLRILTLAHGVREKKPDVLERALNAMDELIWSMQPKADAAERRELLSRLPSILANVNAWLNAIKWHEPERASFFTALAERHAALVRLQSDSSNSRVEAAVAMARRAAARSMARERRMPAAAESAPARSPAAELCHGDWLELQNKSGVRQCLKLAWISPERSQFIFADRRASTTMLYSESELDHALREGRARTIALDRAVDRALDAALGAS